MYTIKIEQLKLKIQNFCNDLFFQLNIIVSMHTLDNLKPIEEDGENDEDVRRAYFVPLFFSSFSLTIFFSSKLFMFSNKFFYDRNSSFSSICFRLKNIFWEY